MLPRITKIIQVEPFKIQLLWNNSEVREIDFDIFFKKWVTENNQNLLRLENYEDFKQVTLSDEKTLIWHNLSTSFTFKGQNIIAPLDLDPDVIYENSRLIKKVERISIGYLLKKAREEANLTQLQVAQNAGTTRNYISRIENEQSEIQLDTLQKIIELGMGRKLKLEII
jgi:DNA-binding XRE family transcriptional regulator